MTSQQPADLGRYDLRYHPEFAYNSVMHATQHEEQCVLWCMRVGHEAEACEEWRFSLALPGQTMPEQRNERTGALFFMRFSTYLDNSACNNACREICKLELKQGDLKIGGVGTVVEIDETSLKKKPKYNRSTRHEDHWLFGGVERSTGRWFGCLVGGDRTKQTLSELIAKQIAPGTTIISDKFVAYVSPNERHTLENNPLLRDKGYTHLWVNYSRNFVGPP
ncbi:hypothetical protein LEN26_014109 [Aphanomyces euteiches]|nr:hypothetical protein LEN26_014109 [Aphanomyces euteiches]KAH9117342.1 hypothetical protein AeMF1_008884 [Aphanomyces euteiches]KAH9186892.1 hypothetical protein AeNC1_011132 [Aphanomyces euteiches]